MRDAMVGERWLGCLMRCLALGTMVGVGGCASVEYRVPTWEVQRLTQLPPAMRGGEVRVVPSDAVVPPPPALVAEAPPPPEVGVDVELPVVVAPRPVVVAPRPVVFPVQVGRTVGSGPRAAPPAGGGWKSGPPGNAGGWRPASAPSRPAPTVSGRSSGSGHGSHGGGGGAGAAAGAVVAVAIIAFLGTRPLRQQRPTPHAGTTDGSPSMQATRCASSTEAAWGALYLWRSSAPRI